MVTQTIAFDTASISETGSGTVTAFLFSGTTLTATLASVTEDTTLKGRYTGTVTDIAAGTYRLVVKFDGYTTSEPDYEVTLILSAGTYYAGGVMNALGSGTQVFGHSYLESLKRVEMASGAATLSGAGTGTEVMTSSDSSKTATFTVDGSGNVSAVVWT